MLDFMSDSRHEQLIKAAEECIGLMNVGSDPDAALRYVKKSFDMNDKETLLVSHAVNNSKQLAHLQSSDETTKSDIFPMTNADNVIAANSKADLDTVVDKGDQPDAVEISKQVKKEAVAQSWEVSTNYRSSSFDVEGAKSVLRSAWSLDKVASVAAYDEGTPYSVTNELRLTADTARTQAAHYRDLACASLDKVASAFITTGGPDFAVFEKAAHVSGVNSDIIDIIYDLGPAGLEMKRTQEKTASERLHVSPQIYDLLEMTKSAEDFMLKSADYEAARAVLLAQVSEAERKIAFDFETVSRATEDIGRTGDTAKALLPLDPESVAAMSGKEPASQEAAIDYKTLQSLQNSRASTRIEQLKGDEFIGKHNPADIVDSYNRAVSVNPDFGDAEIVAFVRQDLASKGAVPLDLMIRASNAHKQHTVGG